MEYTSEEVTRMSRAADAIFETYRTAVFYQTEAARDFENVITNGDPRVPSTAEVRAWLSGVVSGSLVARPEEPSTWQKIKSTMKSWVVM